MISRNLHQFLRASVVATLLLLLIDNLASMPAFGQSGTWSKTGNMKTASDAAPAILLQNGQVLVAGGDGSNGLLTASELYNPANGQWTATGSLNVAESGALTLLQNGQVLLTGRDAELYNSSTGNWAVTGNMSTARSAYTQTLLPNGKVLVAGGLESNCVTFPCPAVSVAELYDPLTGTWTATGSMNTARWGHTATPLANGLVLVVGGYGGPGASGALASAELYNAATGRWTSTGSLSIARADQFAVLLPSGHLLVLFGSNDLTGTGLVTSTELYDPATGKWTVNGSTRATAQFSFSVTQLGTGKVLIAGGVNCVYPRPCQEVSLAELYDPSAGASTSTGSLNVARSNHLAILLPNGQVLAAGGETENKVGKFSITSTAELYTP